MSETMKLVDKWVGTNSGKFVGNVSMLFAAIIALCGAIAYQQQRLDSMNNQAIQALYDAKIATVGALHEVKDEISRLRQEISNKQVPGSKKP